MRYSQVPKVQRPSSSYKVFYSFRSGIFYGTASLFSFILIFHKKNGILYLTDKQRGLFYSMVLAIDIGNTNIVLGGFKDDELVFVARMATDTTKTEDEYASQIQNVLAIHDINKSNIEGAIISSVVPPLNSAINKAIQFIYNVKPIMVGPGIKTGINIHCDNPASVGADLICACVAAHHIYGSPSLIVDMGTATKIMVVDKNGSFIGVSIIPGVNIALKALASGTAQLPQISLEAPKSVMGKNTVDCMKSGIVFGNASMIDGMLDRFNEEMGEELPVYGTGGLASTILPHCKHSITLDSDMLLKGLNILYKKNNKL